MKTFSGNFTQQEPIPEYVISAAVDAMRSGRLHRYKLIDGDTSQTALLETEFAACQGAKYCLSCASGGYAMFVAIMTLCLRRGVELKWFGADQPNGYTSRHDSWQYIQAPSLPQSDRILATLCDLRVPLTPSLADCQLIGEIITECMAEMMSSTQTRTTT